jgi:hypothetical protein
MPKTNPRVLEAIYEAYTPRNEEGKPLPDVLYVGRFIDGLIMFIPEFLSHAFPRDPGTRGYRTHLKTLLQDTNPGDRARHYLVKNMRMGFQRPTWPVSKSGRVPVVFLGSNVVDQEPGELLNSPRLERSPETGEVGLFEALRKMKKGKDGSTPERSERYQPENLIPFVPKIREDKRFGLHYLMRGDKVTIDFATRRGEPISMQYELRPLQEGSSLLTPERAVDEVVW